MFNENNDWTVPKSNSRDRVPVMSCYTLPRPLFDQVHGYINAKERWGWVPETVRSQIFEILDMRLAQKYWLPTFFGLRWFKDLETRIRTMYIVNLCKSVNPCFFLQPGPAGNAATNRWVPEGSAWSSSARAGGLEGGSWSMGCRWIFLF